MVQPDKNQVLVIAVSGVWRICERIVKVV